MRIRAPETPPGTTRSWSDETHKYPPGWLPAFMSDRTHADVDTVELHC
jgi:hypothetical protein